MTPEKFYKLKKDWDENDSKYLSFCDPDEMEEVFALALSALWNKFDAEDEKTWPKINGVYLVKLKKELPDEWPWVIRFNNRFINSGDFVADIILYFGPITPPQEPPTKGEG